MYETKMSFKTSGLNELASTKLALELWFFAAMKSQMLRKAASIFVRFSALGASEFLSIIRLR